MLADDELGTCEASLVPPEQRVSEHHGAILTGLGMWGVQV